MTKFLFIHVYQQNKKLSLVIIEFYCPGCAVMVEVEYLPPGHPLTWGIQLDIDALKKKHGIKETKARRKRPQIRMRKARKCVPGSVPILVAHLQMLFL